MNPGRYHWTETMRHGTDNGYSNGGCRCEPCTVAHRDRRREREHDSGRAYPLAVRYAHGYNEAP